MNRYLRLMVQILPILSYGSRIIHMKISGEPNFYQQVTDIYAISIDCDPRANLTKEFFATVQNKLHYAVHEHTAAETIYDRVDCDKPLVGMINFKGDYITRDDVKIVKNYLTESGLQRLNLWFIANDRCKSWKATLTKY